MRARDVARVAGVSESTVSRALSRPQAVAPQTLTRVLDTAAAMGYRLSAAARSLATGRQGAIGLVVPDLENPLFASLTKGVQSRARADGWSVMLAHADEGGTTEEEVVLSLSRYVDATVLCSPKSPDAVLGLLASRSTLVLVDRESGPIPAVVPDPLEGVRLVFAHLRALGHRRIAYAGGPAPRSNHPTAADAESVAARQPGVELVDLGSFPPDVTGGHAAADLLIASGATAVVAHNDLVALGMLTRLRRRGVDVPRDMSVVGLEEIPVSRLTSPTLTSVHVPLVACGRAAAAVAIGLRRHPDRPATHFYDLSPRLVVRESTGPAVSPGQQQTVRVGDSDTDHPSAGGFSTEQ